MDMGESSSMGATRHAPVRTKDDPLDEARASVHRVRVESNSGSSGAINSTGGSMGRAGNELMMEPPLPVSTFDPFFLGLARKRMERKRGQSRSFAELA
jgi:hypothetical protein